MAAVCFVVKKLITILVGFIVLCDHSRSVLAFVGSKPSDNTTDKYLLTDNGNNFVHPQYRNDRRDREPRFFSFETRDDNIAVEIAFNVPFITIPAKRTMDSSMSMAQSILQGLPKANLNVGAVVLAGAMIFGATVAVPTIFKLFNLFPQTPPATTNTDDDLKYTWSRGLESGKSEMWRILTQVDDALMAHDIDTTSCTQRAVCWLVKNSSSKVEHGEATSMEKIIDGIMSSDWVKSLISGTALQDAMASGRRGDHCAQTYPLCKLSQASLQDFAHKYKAKKRGN